MLGLPRTTEYGKRIPKQKFYDNLSISQDLKRVFVEQIATVYWSNKISADTLNVAAGDVVKEIEVFTIRLNQSSLDTRVLQQIDKQIPYHILFVLEYEDKVQAWIGYKEPSLAGTNSFKVNSYYHTDWINKYAGSDYEKYIGDVSFDKSSRAFLLRIVGLLSDFTDYQV